MKVVTCSNLFLKGTIGDVPFFIPEEVLTKMRKKGLIPQKTGNRTLDYLVSRGFKYNGNVRTDPDLLEWIETHQGAADIALYGWRVVTIPDDVEWEIEEYDGVEWVSEKHRRWH